MMEESKAINTPSHKYYPVRACGLCYAIRPNKNVTMATGTTKHPIRPKIPYHFYHQNNYNYTYSKQQLEKSLPN
jgi:hypothetical protein